MTDIDTLALAKRELWEAMKGDGADCPCCHRFAKLYAYTISQAQVNAFAWIAKNTGLREFINVQEHAPRWLLKSNSHGKLVHWNLLHTAPNDDPTKKMPGRWGVTLHGRQWIAGAVKVRKYALVFDNERRAFEGEGIAYADIFDAFDYSKLMATTANKVAT